MLKPAAAELPLPSSVTVWPIVAVPGEATMSACGASACASAPDALNMPAPQVAVVHWHSWSCTSV